jgi:hypothetical protein
LITPDVVSIFVRIDDAFRHGGPHLAEHLDHLPPMGEIRLRVDHNAPGPVDESGIGVTHAVLFDQDRKAVVTDLFHLHEHDFLFGAALVSSSKLPVSTRMVVLLLPSINLCSGELFLNSASPRPARGSAGSNLRRLASDEDPTLAIAGRSEWLCQHRTG